MRISQKISKNTIMSYLKIATWVFSFVSGFNALAFEYTLAKFAGDMLGNSPRQWAITIGIIFLAMGLGSDHQKKIPDKNLLKRFFYFEVSLSLVGGLAPLLLLEVFSYDRMQYMALHYVVIFAVGYFIGAEIPTLVRLNSKREKLPQNLALIFRLDYFGGFLGSLFWAFFLLPYFPNMIISALVLGVINLLAAIFFVGMLLRANIPSKKEDSAKEKNSLLLETSPNGGEKNQSSKILRQYDLRYLSKASWTKWIFYPLSIAALLVLLLAMYYSESWVESWEQRLFRDKVVATEESPWQRIVLTKNRAGILNGYINGQLQFSSLDEYMYHEVLVHPAMALKRNVESVLILGGGDGLALREVKKYSRVKKITIVDIDKKMIELARTNKDLVALNEGSFFNEREAALFNAKQSNAKQSLKADREMADLGEGNTPPRDNVDIDKPVRLVVKIMGWTISGKWGASPTGKKTRRTV